MPVKRFRSVEEMPDVSWYPPGDPRLFAAMRQTWAFSARAFPRHFPAGVYRHRSAEQAQALADEWERADLQRLRERRRARAADRADRADRAADLAP